MSGWKEYHGPDTYLNGARNGWPQDHSSEDAFDLPPTLPAHRITGTGAPEYNAEFDTDGSTRVYLYTPRKLIGSFETHHDAQLCAEALNNLKGY